MNSDRAIVRVIKARAGDWVWLGWRYGWAKARRVFAKRIRQYQKKLIRDEQRYE